MYTPRQSIAVSTKSCPYDGIPFLSALRPEYAAGAKVSELCRKHGMSDATFYKWKARYGGLQISDVRRLKDLESENGKLKKLLAETMLDNAGLKGLLAKNF